MAKYLQAEVAEKAAELERDLTEAEAQALKAELRFTEHDLRAKVGSDSETEQEAQQRLGHQDAKTTRRVYRRKPQLVPVLNIRKGRNP